MIGRTFLFLTLVLFLGLTPVKSATFTFSNTNTIVINDSNNPPTAASLYPSTNLVTGLAGSIISKVTVQIFGLAHAFPSDIDIVLVGPKGENTILMANVGGQTTALPVTNINLTLDDAAATSLPVDTALTSGTFKPTQGGGTFLFDFPLPAPATSNLAAEVALTNFNNTEPNGTWSLFVVDDTSADSGIITGGWSLTITTTPVLLSITKQQTNAVLSWTNAVAGYTLQSTPSLSSPAWTNINIAPVVVSGFYTVTNAITNSTLFYRLAK